VKRRCVCFGSAWVLALWVCGCGAGAKVSGPAPTTGPAPLPVAATLPLERLSPPIQAPKDASDADRLPGRAADIVARAEALLKKADYFNAARLLERARGFAPSSPRIRRALGLAYAGLGDRAKAEPNLLSSAEAAPDHVRVQLLLGQYAAMQRQVDRALLRYRTALLCSDATDDNPDTAEVLARLGPILERRGYWAAALECYDRLARLVAGHARAYAARPSLRSLVERPEEIKVARGRMLLKLRRPREAAVVLEQAYRADKSHRQAGRLAVRALLDVGQFDRAESIILEMLDEPLQRRRGVQAAVDYCRTRKDPKAPRRLLETFLARGGRYTPLVIAMAEAAAELGDVQEATAVLKTHLSTVPEDGQVVLRLARLYVRTKDLTSAAREFARLLAMNVTEASQVREELGSLVRSGVDRDFVGKLASAAQREKPELRPAVLCVAGMLAEAIDQRDLAVELFRQAVAADARLWPAYEGLERLYSRAGDLAAIERLTRQVANAAGDSYFKFYLRGKVDLARGRISEGIKNLEEARLRRGEHVPTLLLLGRAYLQQRRYRQAERRLLEAAGVAPENLAVVRELFGLYMHQRRFKIAAELVNRYLEANPTSVPVRAMRARCHLVSGQVDRARRELDALLSQAPEDPDVLLLQVRFDLPEKVDKQPLEAKVAGLALRRLKRILRLAPGHVEAVCNPAGQPGPTQAGGGGAGRAAPAGAVRPEHSHCLRGGPGRVEAAAPSRGGRGTTGPGRFAPPGHAPVRAGQPRPPRAVRPGRTAGGEVAGTDIRRTGTGGASPGRPAPVRIGPAL